MSRVIVQGSNVVLHGDSHDIHIKFLEQCRFRCAVSQLMRTWNPLREFQTKKPVGVATWLLTARSFSHREKATARKSQEENNSTTLRHLFKAAFHLVPE